MARAPMSIQWSHETTERKDRLEGMRRHCTLSVLNLVVQIDSSGFPEMLWCFGCHAYAPELLAVWLCLPSFPFPSLLPTPLLPMQLLTPASTSSSLESILLSLLLPLSLPHSTSSAQRAGPQVTVTLPDALTLLLQPGVPEVSYQMMAVQTQHHESHACQHGEFSSSCA